MSLDGKQAIRKAFVGVPLRKKRESAGLTQWDVASRLEYSTAQFISNWERGVSLPPDEALPTIAKMLKLPPSQLLDMIEKAGLEEMKAWKKSMLKQFKKCG